MVELTDERGLSWKLFFQIFTLIILVAIVFYIVYPKYNHGFSLPYRANKITGKVEYWMKGNWHTLDNKNNFFLKDRHKFMMQAKDCERSQANEPIGDEGE